MDYRKHTKERFLERFVPMFKSKKVKYKDQRDFKELTDADYDTMCELCGTSATFKIPSYKKGSKVIIEYKGINFWCVISHKSKIIKTIYPVRNSDYKRYSLEK